MAAALIIVSCAADKELAEGLYNYLISRLPSSKYSLSIEKDEVSIRSEKSIINHSEVRKYLDDFIKSNPDLHGYSITEFENVFTIGVRQNLDKAIHSCEMCGYLTLSEGDLINHKRIHAIF
jgi:hypothetical protein